MGLAKYQLFYLSQSKQPYLEILERTGRVRSTPFTRLGEGRRPGEGRWLAEPALPTSSELWRVRVNLGGGGYDPPSEHDYYTTCLRNLWLQDGQIFSYQPAAVTRRSWPPTSS